MHADAKNVGAHLDKPGSPVHRLLHQARRFGEIQQILRQILRDWTLEPLARSLRIANERDGVVVVYVDSAAAFTQLRYRQQDLIQAMRDRLNSNSLMLEIKMRPAAQNQNGESD